MVLLVFGIPQTRTI